MSLFIYLIHCDLLSYSTLVEWISLTWMCFCFFLSKKRCVLVIFNFYSHRHELMLGWHDWQLRYQRENEWTGTDFQRVTAGKHNVRQHISCLINNTLISPPANKTRAQTIFWFIPQSQRQLNHLNLIIQFLKISLPILLQAGPCT